MYTVTFTAVQKDSPFICKVSIYIDRILVTSHTILCAHTGTWSSMTEQ